MSRVLLIYHNALFAHSIRTALRAAHAIQLVGELDDWTHIDAEIVRLAPDVVLVEEDESAATDAILGTLRAYQSPWRMVALQLDERTMHVWSGASKEISTPQDLYDVLKAVPRRQRKIFRTTQRMILTHGGR